MRAVLINQEDLTGNDSEIRTRVKTYANGEYCVTICKKCGRYFHTPEGDTDTAEIVDKCKFCFDK